MTLPIHGFITDVFVGPWVVPQKVQTSFLNSYADHNCYSIIRIYSKLNTNSDLDEFFETSRDSNILFFSRWQAFSLLEKLSYFQHGNGRLRLIFALEDITYSFTAEGIGQLSSDIEIFRRSIPNDLNVKFS